MPTPEMRDHNPLSAVGACAIGVAFAGFVSCAAPAAGQEGAADLLLEILPALIAGQANDTTPPDPAPAPDPDPDPIVDPDDGLCTAVLDGPVISVDTTLSNSPRYCDYYLRRPSADPGSAKVLILEGAKLTIEPGVVIRLERSMTIRVAQGGAVEAIGTAQRPIRFEGEAPGAGYADGFWFSTGSLASRFEHVELVGIGNDGPDFSDPDGAFAGNAAAGGVALRNVTVSGSSVDGANFEKLPVIEFANNRFVDNRGHALRIGPDQLHKLDANSDFVGGNTPNDKPSIFVEGVFQPVRESTTWPNLNAPYFVFVGITVEDGGDVTIEPGTRFVMDEGAAVTVKDGARLRALGTASAPIVFDGAQATPGYWDNVRFFDTAADNRLEYVVARNGGKDGIFDGIINLSQGSRVTVRNSEISGSATYGVCADVGTRLDLDAATVIVNNRLGNISDDC